MTAVLGFNNFQQFAGDIVSVNTSTPGDTSYPVKNLLDYSTYTKAQFEPSGGPFTFAVTLSREIAANYIGLAGHNIPNGTTIEIYTGFTLLTEVTTVGTGPQFLIFPDDEQFLYDTYTVVVYRTTGLYEIGSFYMGVYLPLPQELQAPLTPPHLARDVTVFPNTVNKGAEFLGTRSQRVGWSFSIEQNHVDPAWVLAFWFPLSFYLERAPFFYLYDTTTPGVSMYAWLDGSLPKPKYTNPVHMSFKINCRGLYVV